MDNKKIAGKIVIGSIGLTIGLAFLRSGTKELLDALTYVSDDLAQKIANSK